MDNEKWIAYLGKAFTHFICFAFVCIALASCSHVKRHDGPPNFYVDETRIPDATPRHEPLARYGNMSSYKVFGKRYYPMKSAKHYEAVGTASWYGTMFNTHRTSSGETYDMLGMTAAHKTLPLPTYVEVTNLKNQRKIIVKVNDRGPFESNRLIDLSYVAAKKLGMLGHGTAMVKVKAIDPAAWHQPNDFWLASNQHPSNTFVAQTPLKRTYSYYLQNNRSLSSKPRANNHRASRHYAYSFNTRKKVSPREIPFQYYPTSAARNHKLHSKKQMAFARNKHISKRTMHARASRHSATYLQVGAFKKKNNALKLQHRLLGLLNTPVVLHPSPKSKLYHVRVGPIKDLSLEKRLTSRLKGLGIKSNKIGA